MRKISGNEKSQCPEGGEEWRERFPKLAKQLDKNIADKKTAAEKGTKDGAPV